MKRKYAHPGSPLVPRSCAVASFYFTRSRETRTTGLRVPLGVEQAAIVTYSGPLLAVAPYKWGVAVNVRIAEVTENAA